MKARILNLLFLNLILAISAHGQHGKLEPFEAPHRGFVSWKPAPTWEDALLGGNGTIGTLTFGNPHNETIIVNHALLHMPVWNPLPPINQASRLDEIRELIAQGRYEEATAIPVEQSMKEGYGEMRWIDPLVPLCNIIIRSEEGNVLDYIRMVDFETGEAKVQWEQDGQLYQRRLFVSRADSVIVMSITSTGELNLRITLRQHPIPWEHREFVRRGIANHSVRAEGEFLVYKTEFVNKNHGMPHGFEAVAMVDAKGGAIRHEGQEIIIGNTNEVLLMMAVEPQFDMSHSNVKSMKSLLKHKQGDYSSLLYAQRQTHGELFARVRLELGEGYEAGLQSESFVLRAQGGSTPTIVEKQFDAARYNIISSTGTNPPTLQGIWSGTWTPPWSSGFTHNGNVQVAVSHLLSGNTPELMEAYLRYHERMLPYYRDNAKRLFGARGIHVPAHSSSHGWNIHFNQTWCLSFWTGGAGWTAGILYDYYLYTGDIELLRTRIYPFMKESALFYEDFLIMGDDGRYVFTPSYSPENNPANSASQLTVNATMDIMIASELLRNLIEAGQKLGEDRARIRTWERMLERMPDYRITAQGELAEWIPAGYEENHSHRHVSQLYSLFERIDPEFRNNPALIEAALNTVEERMYHRRRTHGGEMVFGLAQLGMVTANTGQRELTAEIIDLMSRNYWSASLATFHNVRDLFNMDMSGGFPAVILRALVYSEPGKIKLLPGLPPQWAAGSAEGIALRGQVVADRLSWNENSVEVTLTSAICQRIELTTSGLAGATSDRVGALRINRRRPDVVELRLRSGESQTITIRLAQ